jgi:hypothetical protein
MDNGDYTDMLYDELRATREQLLQARLAIVGVNAWLEAGERDDWRSPTFPRNALKELKAYLAWVESTQPKKEEEVAP